MWWLPHIQLNYNTNNLATDFEVFRYYDLKTHIKGDKYIHNLPELFYDGIKQNEFQYKINQYLQLEENDKIKIKIKIKVKKRLPYFEKKFSQIKNNN